MSNETVPDLEEDVEETRDDETEENNNAKRKRNDSSDFAEPVDESTKKIKPEENSYGYSISTGGEQSGYGVPIANTSYGSSSGEGDSIMIEVSPEKVGQIIGSKGAIIQEIQTRTGAKAFVNQDFPDGVNRQVNLTGTASAVKAASDLIHLILEQGPQAIHMNSVSGGPVITSVMECTQDQVGKVIGTKGATIKELQSKSGARIQIDQDFPPEAPRKINMTGTASAVAMAAQLITQVLAGGAASAGLTGGGDRGGMYGGGGGMYGGGGGGYNMYGAPQMMPPAQQYGGGAYGGGGETKNHIDVPKSVVGKIIGTGGETIKVIQKKSGARIQVDQAVPDGQPCRIAIHGTPQGVVMAQQLIQEVMNGVPTGQLGASLGGGMGGPSPYGMPMQAGPYGGGMPGYGMPPMQQMAPQYGGGGYGGYAPQQMPAYGQQPYGGMPAAGGYQAYGAAAGGAMPSAYPAAAAAYQQPAVSAAPKAAAAPVWTEHKTDDGITYWYNASTGVSQWERPKGM